MESLNLQAVAVLIPLEIKRHTVPHLKLSHIVLNVEVGMGMAVLSSSAKLLRKVLFYFINGPNGGSI